MAESRAFRALLEWQGPVSDQGCSPLLPAIDDVGWSRERLFEKSTKDGSAQNNNLPDLPVMTGAMDGCARPIPHLPWRQFETAIRACSQVSTNNIYMAVAQIRGSRQGAINRSWPTREPIDTSRSSLRNQKLIDTDPRPNNRDRAF
jgi:hypothetical protein